MFGNSRRPDHLAAEQRALYSGGTGLDRVLDEVRMAPIARTPDWIEARHRMFTASFAKVGAVEQVGAVE